MSPNVYQKLALTTAKELRVDEMILNGALGICGEGGEIADHIKKFKFQDHPINSVEIAKELGDVCWYVSYLAYAIGYDFEEILQMNIEKLKKRFPEGFQAERSVNRDE